jgi:hypothetical protein
MEKKRHMMRPVLPLPMNTEEYMPPSAIFPMRIIPIQLEKLSLMPTQNLTVQQYRWLVQGPDRDEKPSSSSLIDRRLF